MHHAGSFGTWLQRRREDRGFTREDLAAQVGYAVETIRKIERDERRPSLQVVGKLAACLAIPDDERVAFFHFARTGQPLIPTVELAPNNDKHSIPERFPLPVPLTPLVGRQHDIAQARELLVDPAIRAVTITGPPGVGKTRLALHVAADLEADFDDGVVWVPLAPLSGSDWVMTTIADRVGVKEGGQQSLLALLVAYLRSRRILLVVDNFEHVHDARRALAELLQLTPGVKVLVTSRIVLGIGGEHVVPLAPLEAPDSARLTPLAELTRYAAIELFVQRARAVHPPFRLTPANAPAVAEICHRLDGLPLALELAAARLAVLTSEALLHRLRTGANVLHGGSQDTIGRQVTLRNAIAWSYEALPHSEQHLLMTLSVCRGGFTLAAAEELAKTFGDGPETVLESIGGLIGNSLLVRAEPSPVTQFDPSIDIWLSQNSQRFGMLELIREYALEQLVHRGNEPRARHYHSEHYVWLAERAERELAGPGVKVWSDVLEQEHDNFRAALTWLIANADFERAGRLAAALWQFWESRAYITEGLHWLDILCAAQDRMSLQVRADVINAAGRLAHNQGNLVRAREHFMANLELRRQIGDGRRLGYALNDLGIMLAYSGDADEGIALLDEGLAAFRAAGDVGGIADIQLNFGYVLINVAKNIEQAVIHLEEGLTAFEQVGNARGIMATTGNLGYAYAQLNDPRALPTMRGALALAQRLDDKIGCLYGIIALATYLICEEEPEQGVRLLSAAEASRVAMGLQPVAEFDVPGAMATARDQLGPNVFDAMWEVGQDMSLEQAVAYALGSTDS